MKETPADTLQQLYPPSSTPISRLGAYLKHDIRSLASDGKPYVYANFAASVDGRIAVPHPSGDGLTVPKNVVNERDWRLFQELAAQADLIISSGRYLRDWADGRAQEILQIDDPRFADLREWREDRRLSGQPDIAIISNSLDFPIPEVLRAGGRKVVVFTSADPDPARVAEIEASAGNVYVVGKDGVDGAAMVSKMGELGYHSVYSATGPKVLHMLLDAKVLDRLYLTQVNRLVGGNPYATIVEGGQLNRATNLVLNTMYFDHDVFNGVGQLLLSYDCGADD